MPDVRSRLELAVLQEESPDPQKWSKAQANDEQLKQILSGSTKCAFQLQARHTPHGPVYSDFSTGAARAYVPLAYRRAVFDSLHGLAHGGRKATTKLIETRYCWPDMNREIARWTRCCVQCQRAKINKHTASPVAAFPLAESRFGHIHIDVVGPLPPASELKYLLTCVDRFTRWPEAWLLTNISAHVVATTLVNQWVSRFGLP